MDLRRDAGRRRKKIRKIPNDSEDRSEFFVHLYYRCVTTFRFHADRDRIKEDRPKPPHPAGIETRAVH